MPLYRLPVFLGPPRHNLHRPQRAPSRWGHFFVRRTNEGSPARRADVSESVIGAEWCHCGLVVEGKMLIALKIENALRTLVAELSARPGRP